ncbi:hypothetical protein VIGAN_10154100, partial [Vigna angularis var. angularis]
FDLSDPLPFSNSSLRFSINPSREMKKLQRLLGQISSTFKRYVYLSFPFFMVLISFNILFLLAVFYLKEADTATKISMCVKLCVIVSVFSTRMLLLLKCLHYRDLAGKTILTRIAY